jgi:hypothetical protein
MVLHIILGTVSEILDVIEAPRSKLSGKSPTVFNFDFRVFLSK